MVRTKKERDRTEPESDVQSEKDENKLGAKNSCRKNNQKIIIVSMKMMRPVRSDRMSLHVNVHLNVQLLCSYR